MDWIFKKRRATLSIAAVSLVLMLASIMVRAFYTDGNFHPSIGWDILFLSICTCCFGAFALWVFTKGFGPNSLGEKLTISEKDAIRRQFYRCWIVPAGAKDLKKLVVSIRIKLNEDGEVVNTKLLTDSNLNNPFFRAASESAMRAVNHPECKKLQVPKKKYETWKEIILDFDPSQSLN